jgi:hypothetical protein
MFKKRNCFCSKEKVGILDGTNQLFNEEGVDVKNDVLNKNNQLPPAKDSRSCVVVDLLSSAIIRLEMKSRSNK